LSWRILLAVAIAVVVFVSDTFTSFRGALAVLYTASIVLVAHKGGTRRLIVVGLLCGLASTVSFLTEHWGEPPNDATIRFAVALVAIAITTLLLLLNKAAEARQRETDARYRSIFNAAGFAIWESDWSGALPVIREAEAAAGGEDLEAWLNAHREWVRRAGRTLRWEALNAEALRLFGIADRRWAVGSGPDETWIGTTEGVLAHIFACLARGERAVECETQIRKPSGETVTVVLRVTRPESDQAWRRILAMAVDVTARKEAQARLELALSELAHVSRVTTLGQLAASIVHEVNQPLSAVITYGRSGLRWIAREAPEAREASECLERMVANAGRAADVIARVRDLARKTAPQSEPVELGTLIDETLALLRREVQDRGIVVRRQVAPNTPAVLGDRVQIQQVLMNLVMNAAQAMEHTAEPRREISIAVGELDGMVSVSVRDHGGGIAGVEPNRIFEPFVSTKAQGLGIGLSICRSIIEGHGGRIWAANTEDGAEVAFDLPVEPAERAA
jgi:C4-dicarboxylate-specific signal transduction histidine kinase